jgi:hypothetical protein
MGVLTFNTGILAVFFFLLEFNSKLQQEIFDHSGIYFLDDIELEQRVPRDLDMQKSLAGEVHDVSHFKIILVRHDVLIVIFRKVLQNFSIKRLFLFACWPA